MSVAIMYVAIQPPAANQPTSLIFVAAVIVLFVLFLALAIFSAMFMLRPWLRAFLSGVPLALTQLVGMRLRRSPVSKIIECGILAAQAGHPLPWAELEKAAIQKVDLELVTTAWVQGNRDKLGLSWEELVDAARHSRIEKLLEDRRKSR